MAGTGNATGITVERDGAVVRLWLDRPAKHNPLGTATLEQIVALYESFATDYEVRVVVLGGRGPSFSAGADLNAPPGSERMSRRGGAGERERRWWSQLGHRAVAAVADAEVVTIARLHGNVLGGGLCLALACDFRVAAADARLGLPEVDLGMPFTPGMNALIPARLPATTAHEAMVTGRRYTGPEALAAGIVSRLSDEDRVVPDAVALAAPLASKAGPGLARIRTTLHAGVIALLLDTGTDAAV